MKAYSIIFFVSAFMFVIFVCKSNYSFFRFEYFAIDALYFEDAFELVVSVIRADLKFEQPPLHRFLISSCVILGMSVYRFFFSDWGTPTPDLWACRMS